MNKGMAMVAIDELKKAREEAVKFAQETDNAIMMLIGNTLGERDDADVVKAIGYLSNHKTHYNYACARVDKVQNIVHSQVFMAKK